MTPEEYNLKLHRLILIENIFTLAAIVGIAFAFGWPYGMWGFLLLLNLGYTKWREK